MNFFVKILMLLTLSTTLVACGITKQDPSVIRQQSIDDREKQAACESRKKIEAEQEAVMVSHLSESAQMMYMALKAQAKTVAAATGHKIDECDTGTNYNDVLITEVKEKNHTVRTLVPDVVKTVVTGAVVVKGLDVLDKAVSKDTTSVRQGDGSVYEDNKGAGNIDKSSKSETIHEAAEPEVPEVPEEGEEGEFVPTEPPAEFDDEPIDIPEIPAEGTVVE